MSAKVVVTGAAGFLGTYVVSDLLSKGYRVTGIDNLSKYGELARTYDNDPRYTFVRGDATDPSLMAELMSDASYLIANAAMVGGIGYFNSYPYDLLSTNNRIMSTTCDVAIEAHNHGHLERVVYVSSSMVYESADRWPSREGDEESSPPPQTSYGMQKLVTEYYARAAWSQYKLPYVIVRPFNCVGIGEVRDVRSASTGDRLTELALSHVVPDLIRRILLGENPVRILGDGQQIRHFTYGGDIASAISVCMTAPKAENETFNISTASGMTVLDAAELIWHKIHPGKSFSSIHEEPYRGDVARRIPSVSKARDMLGVVCDTDLGTVLDELIPWVKGAMQRGLF